MQCISKGEEEGRKNQCDSIIRIDAKINRKNVQTWTDKFNGKFLAQIVTFWNEWNITLIDRTLMEVLIDFEEQS